MKEQSSEQNLYGDYGDEKFDEDFDDYGDFFTASQNGNWNDITNQEQDKYHTTHTTIGALMAQDWSLPETIVDAIYNVHYCDGIFASGELEEETLRLLAVLKLARHFARVFQNPNEADEEWQELEGQVCEFLDMEDGALTEMQEDVLMGLEDEAGNS